jgi:UDP-GlcNAc:undecaprenyl-phosphate GlcNAc-1-phosphate transferase
MFTSEDIILLVLAMLAVIVTSEVLSRKGAAWGLVARRDLAAGKRIPTAGGLGFVPGLIGVLLLAGIGSGDWTWFGAAGATFLLAVLGLIDDAIDLPPAVKLAVEIAICAPVAWLMFGPDEAGKVLLYLLLLVGTINVVNFSDNMDGLAVVLAGTTAVGACICAALRGDANLVMIAGVAVAICAAFFVHNRPPARVHMGDTGSTSLGFTLGLVLAKLLTGDRHAPMGTMAAAVGLLLGVMLLDGAQVIAARAIIRRPIMPGDRRHLSHRWLTSVLDPGKVLLRLWLPHVVFVAAGVLVFGQPQLWVLVGVPMLMTGVVLVHLLWKVPGDEYPKGPPPATAAG